MVVHSHAPVSVNGQEGYLHALIAMASAVESMDELTGVLAELDDTALTAARTCAQNLTDAAGRFETDVCMEIGLRARSYSGSE